MHIFGFFLVSDHKKRHLAQNLNKRPATRAGDRCPSPFLQTDSLVLNKRTYHVSGFPFIQKIKEKSGLCFLLLLLSSSLSSQTLHFKNFSAAEGLITDEVYHLHQDRQGYIWVFSRFGALKYNGTEFKPVLRNLSYKDDFIYCLYENKRGQIWVANSNARIYEIRNDSAFMIKGIEKESEALKNAVSEIQKLYVDDSLNVTAITKGKSYKFLKKGDVYVARELNKMSLHSNSIIIKLFESNEYMYGNYSYYKNYEFLPRPEKAYLKLENTGEMILLPVLPKFLPFFGFQRYGSDIYFASGTHLLKLDSKKRITDRDLGSRMVKFFRDKNGHMWVPCFNDGLYELDEKDSIIGHYLKNTTVNDVLIDNNHGLWASTPGQGLFYCENVNYKVFEEEATLGVPISFIREIDGQLFIANSKGALFMTKDDSIIQIREPKKINFPMTIIKRKKNRYLFLNTLLTETIDLNDKTHPRITSEKCPNRIRVVLKSEDTLIYTWPRGIIFNVRNVDHKQIDFKQRVLASELIGNIIWIGTENGVYPYPATFTKSSDRTDRLLLLPDRDSLILPEYLREMAHAAVSGIVADKFNTIWFTTRGDGMFRLQNKKLQHFTVDNGLPSNIINQISFTKEHAMLLSTNRGLFMSEPETGSPGQSRRYIRWKTLFHGEVKSAVQFKTRIYISGRDGLGIFDQDKETLGAEPFFNLSSIDIDLNEISREKFESIGYQNNNLTFKFDVVNFTWPKPPVKYVITGAISDSGLVNNATVTLKRLPPGSYSLTAWPLTKEGRKVAITIPFSVVPAFWQTTAFKVTMIIVIIAILGLLLYFILRNINKKAKARTKNEQLVLEYKLIALKAQINPHFISNCLSAIQSLILNADPDQATFYVARFGLMVRQILDVSSKSVITLTEELELVRIYLELEQLRFENKFVFSIHVDDDISQKNTFVPPMLLNPIVENAIWHGLMPLKPLKDKTLSIDVKTENNCLVLTITDNGVGRPDVMTVPVMGRSKSYGIQLTQQRLTNINYLYQTTEAKIIFIDLKDMDDSPAGTQVTIYLPLNLVPFRNEG